MMEKAEKKEVTYTIHLPENYERQEYCNLVKIVDEEHGNPLKVWHDLGEPANPSKDEVSLLREVAKPWITTQTVKAENDCLEISFCLEKNAVAAFELKPVERQQDTGYDYERVISQKVKKDTP